VLDCSLNPTSFLGRKSFPRFAKLSPAIQTASRPFLLWAPHRCLPRPHGVRYAASGLSGPTRVPVFLSRRGLGPRMKRFIGFAH
jgi:hypothetical protein